MADFGGSSSYAAIRHSFIFKNIYVTDRHFFVSFFFMTVLKHLLEIVSVLLQMFS